MSIEQLIVSKLRDNAAVAAKVARRIRPLAFTQLDKRPCLAYQVVNTEAFEHMQGSADWLRISLQLDCFADTYAEAKATARLCRDVLHNYVGTVEGIEVGFVKHKEDSDLTEPPDVGQERVIHRLSSSYLILYREV
jgi:hypothetical protein